MPAGPEANNPIYRALIPNTFTLEPGNTLKVYTQSRLVLIHFHSSFSIEHACHYNLMLSAEINMTEAEA